VILFKRDDITEDHSVPGAIQPHLNSKRLKIETNTRRKNLTCDDLVEYDSIMAHRRDFPQD